MIRHCYGNWIGRARHALGSVAAFSLLELLVAMALMVVSMAWVGPAFQAIKSSVGVNWSITRASCTLDYARSYAISGHTYVRVGIGQTSNTEVNPSTVFVVIYSTDGTLDADTAPDMVNASKWRFLVKPVVLENLAVTDRVAAQMTLDSSNYTSPSQTDIPPVQFQAGGCGTVTCNGFIQFSPKGEARVMMDDPVRFIDLAMDKPAPQNGRNPFVLRIARLSGNINILRQGDGIQ